MSDREYRSAVIWTIGIAVATWGWAMAWAPLGALWLGGWLMYLADRLENERA